MVTSRTRMVKAMMAKPILLNSNTYNTIKVFSMGRMITSSQTLTRRVKISKGVSYPARAGPLRRRSSRRADVCECRSTR